MMIDVASLIVLPPSEYAYIVALVVCWNNMQKRKGPGPGASCIKKWLKLTIVSGNVIQ
jgi:hypothetical protein